LERKEKYKKQLKCSPAAPAIKNVPKVANQPLTPIWNGSLKVVLTCLHGKLVAKNIISLALKVQTRYREPI